MNRRSFLRFLGLGGAVAAGVAVARPHEAMAKAASFPVQQGYIHGEVLSTSNSIDPDIARWKQLLPDDEDLNMIVSHFTPSYSDRFVLTLPKNTSPEEYEQRVKYARDLLGDSVDVRVLGLDSSVHLDVYRPEA